MTPATITALGDRALLISLGHAVDARTSALARALAQQLRALALPGVTDVVPAFTTVALHCQADALQQSPGGGGSSLLQQQVQALLDAGIAADAAATRSVEVPVCYGGAHGPDLAEVAQRCGLSPEEVVALHGASAHVVHMLGFSPGFPYMGGLDAALAVPRRATPRTVVPAGSVAIARDQSAIYPQQAPGGWNLIGRTPLVLFDATAAQPCLLLPGDAVRFVPITAAQFDAMAQGRP